MADPVNPYSFPTNLNILHFVTLKLNDNNYLLWKTQFESLLSSQKLIGFVNGSITPPEPRRTVVENNVTTETANPQYEFWFCTDQLARSWLFGTLSEEVLGYVHNLTTAREVWISLAENFNKSSLAREFSLRRSLQLVTSKGKTLPAYSREFKTLCDSLSSIGKPVDESLKIFGFLNGLGREYDPIATVIQSSLTKFPQPTFNDVVSEVQGFEAKLKSYEDNTTVTPHLAFATQTSETSQEQKVYAPSYNPNYRGRGRSTYRGRGGYSTRGRGFVQHQSPSNSSGERPVWQICGRTGHTALKCYNRFDNNYQSPTAYTLVRHNDGRSQEWFPDSGASAHVTASFQNLQTTHPYEGVDAVMVGDGAFLPITHVGSSAITTTSEGDSQRVSK
ncbi:hypothetical protein Bca4012_071560 [Brassica carinata]